MDKVLETISLESWEDQVLEATRQKAINALEEGQILFLPKLSFKLTPQEARFLSSDIVDPRAKNVSYDLKKDKLGGTLLLGEDNALLKTMMNRYAQKAKSLIGKMFPHYSKTIIQARTSFRPVEIAGRTVPSYRKDDTLLHVDSFPANPVKGRRIMRFFTNVNPNNQPRVWRVGEPFLHVAQKMVPRINSPIPGFAHILKWLLITKDYRTAYDHYMLRIHDLMKGDKSYQANVSKHEIHFPAGSSWIVFTDQVSHAAISGKDVFEQTFYLPVEGLKDEQTSPLRTLERVLNKKLI